MYDLNITIPHLKKCMHTDPKIHGIDYKAYIDVCTVGACVMVCDCV